MFECDYWQGHVHTLLVKPHSDRLALLTSTGVIKLVLRCSAKLYNTLHVRTACHYYLFVCFKKVFSLKKCVHILYCNCSVKINILFKGTDLLRFGTGGTPAIWIFVLLVMIYLLHYIFHLLTLANFTKWAKNRLGSNQIDHTFSHVFLLWPVHKTESFLVPSMTSKTFCQHQNEAWDGNQTNVSDGVKNSYFIKLI